MDETADAIRIAVKGGEIRIPRRRIADIQPLASSKEGRGPSGRSQSLPTLGAEVVVPYGWHSAERLPNGALPPGRFFNGGAQAVFLMSPEHIDAKRVPTPRIIVLRGESLAGSGPVRALDEAQRMVTTAVSGGAGTTVIDQPIPLRLAGSPAAHYAVEFADPANAGQRLVQDTIVLIKPDRLYTIDALTDVTQAGRWRSTLREVAEAVRVPTNPEHFPLQRRLVVDQAGVLSETERQALEKAVGHLEASAGVACSVVTAPTIRPYRHPEAYAADLLHLWRLGADRPKGGVLLLVPMDGHPPELQMSFGAEILLPHGLGSAILEQHVVPFLGQPKFGDHVVAAVAEIERRLTR